jgi:acid phosphatase
MEIHNYKFPKIRKSQDSSILRKLEPPPFLPFLLRILTRWFLLFLLAMPGSAGPLLAEFPQEQAEKLCFIAVGDTGMGDRNQIKVADAMASVAEKSRVPFILLLGDNFYPRGVKSTEDPEWRKKFEDIYHHPSLNIPFYAVLGNHDYGGKPKAQILYTETSKRWRMPDRYYSFKRKVGDSTEIEFFAIDTSAMLRKKDNRQISWLKEALKNSRAPWKIVYGHHPIYSYGRHGSSNKIRNQIEFLFAKHKVSLYLAGHNHCLEALKPRKGVYYIVSGAGASPKPVKKRRTTLFAKSKLGFALLCASKKEIDVQFIDKKERLLFNYQIAKESE